MSNCANCCKIDDDHNFITSFNIIDDGENLVQISFKDTLEIIFEHGIGLKQKVTNKNVDLNAAVVQMCGHCTSVFVELYKLYIEFMKLTQINSYLSTILHKSSLWEFDDQQDQHQDIKPALLSLQLVEGNQAQINQSQDEGLQDNFSIIENDERHEEQEIDNFKLQHIKIKEIKSLKSPIILVERLTNAEIESKLRRSTTSKITKKKKTYTCTKCPVSFPSSLQLNYHKKNQHQKVPKPKVKVTTNSDISKSMLKYDPITGCKTYECRLCGKTFPFRERKAYYHHRLLAHTPKQFTCSFPNCTQTFRLATVLDWHMVVKHGIGQRHKDQECPIPGCGKYLCSSYSLKLHLSTMHLQDELKFPCEQCNKKYPTAFRLQLHIQQVHVTGGQRPHSCPNCPCSYKTEKDLNNHIKYKHNVEPQPLVVCPICGKYSSRHDFLGPHMKVHAEEDAKAAGVQLKCEQCDKSFYTTKKLKNHVKRVHEKSEEYACKECGRTFAQGTGLRRHVKLNHTGTYPYICTICGKGFKIMEYLRQHMNSKTHGGLGFVEARKKSSERMKGTSVGKSSSISRIEAEIPTRQEHHQLDDGHPVFLFQELLSIQF